MQPCFETLPANRRPCQPKGGGGSHQQNSASKQDFAKPVRRRRRGVSGQKLRNRSLAQKKKKDAASTVEKKTQLMDVSQNSKLPLYGGTPATKKCPFPWVRSFWFHGWVSYAKKFAIIGCHPLNLQSRNTRAQFISFKFNSILNSLSQSLSPTRKNRTSCDLPSTQF